MKNRLLILVFVIFSVSCKNLEKKDVEKPNIKLYVLDGGSIIVNKLEVFSQDTAYRGLTKQLSDPYYIISHPKGNLIWDAGLPENLIQEKPYTDTSETFTMQRLDSLVSQLETIGFKISDFKYIALSHVHFDHIGHANYFKNAVWLVQENEYNFVTSDSEKTDNPGLYNSISELENVKKLVGDYDVFGDGTVLIKTMPGHTIGHQVLYIEAGLERPILLTGDLYHFEENREKKRVPRFNHDVKETLKSMEYFEAFAKEKNADVIIQHSLNDFERLQILLKK